MAVSMNLAQAQRYSRVTQVITELWESLYESYWNEFSCLPTVVIYYPHGIYRQHAEPIQLIKEKRSKIRKVLASQYGEDRSSLKRAISQIADYKKKNSQKVPWLLDLEEKHFGQLMALSKGRLEGIDPVLLLDVLKAFPLRRFPLEKAIRGAIREAAQRERQLKADIEVILRYSEEDPDLNGIKFIQNGVMKPGWEKHPFSLGKAGHLFRLYNFLERTLLLFDSPNQKVVCSYILVLNDRGTYRGNSALIQIQTGKTKFQIVPGQERKLLESFYHTVNRWVSEVSAAIEFEAQSYLRRQAAEFLSKSPERQAEVLSEAIGFIQQVKMHRRGTGIIFSFVDLPQRSKLNGTSSIV